MIPPGFATVCERAVDDVVSGEVLEWSGLSDYWHANASILDNFSVIRDVLPYCDSCFVQAEQWDANIPGRSGTCFTILTSDPAWLRKQMRERIDELIQAAMLPSARQVSSVVSENSIDSLSDITARLSAIAYGLEQTRFLPAGYAAAPKAIAKKLRGAISVITAGDLSDSEIKAILVGLADGIHLISSGPEGLCFINDPETKR